LQLKQKLKATSRPSLHLFVAVLKMFFYDFFNCRNDLCVWIELFKFNYTIRVIIIICCIIHVLVVFNTKEVFKKYKVVDVVCVFLFLAFCTICYNPPFRSEMPVPSKTIETILNRPIYHRLGG
jgi:hypothetical protein